MPRVELHAPAPEFALLDFAGAEIRLSEFRGTKNVLLVFNRTFV